MTANISAHLSYREATYSPTAVRLGIPNEPDDLSLGRMIVVAGRCFEPARAHFGPIQVTSFYRSIGLNTAIGGSATSDHCLGRAIDLEAPAGAGWTNSDLFEWLRRNVDFDQLIREFPDSAGAPAWVHVSHRSRETNRHQVLEARREAGGVHYYPFEGAPR